MTNKITYPLVSTALVLAIVASLTLGHRPVAADGIGIYPTNLSLEGTARGGEYFRTIGVINSGDSDTTFTLEGEGPIGGWISFVEVHDRGNAIESVSVPGNSERQTLLRVTVPEDAANGDYRGSAEVVARSAEAVQAGEASVGVGAAIDVRINVTGEQRLDGSLIDSSVSDVEEGFPLRVRAVVNNSGNVRFTPEVSLEVLNADSQVVARETFPEASAVFPNESGRLDHEFDISGQDLGEGEYVAHISARAGDLDLGSRDTSFSIFPEGTLTRQGELKNISMAITPSPGNLGKLEIVFVNSGQIDTMAKFVGELYRQDQLIDVLDSEELLVPVNEQKTLELFFPVENPGEHSIKGKINYQGKETQRKELNFTVAEEGPSESSAQASAGGAEDTSPTLLPESEGSSSPPEAEQSVWGEISSTVRESPFNSPLGISVIILGVLVILLLIIMVGRKSREY